MTRDELKKIIINIIIEIVNHDITFFTSQPNEGEDMLFSKEIIYNDPLYVYEILNTIEQKLNILINDEIIFKDEKNMTFGDFIDIFYKEILKKSK